MKLVRESISTKVKDIPKKKWTDVEEDKYADDLIKLVQTAYKKATEGSFINTKKDVVQSDWHSIDFDENPRIFFAGQGKDIHHAGGVRPFVVFYDPYFGRCVPGNFRYHRRRSCVKPQFIDNDNLL